MPFSFIYCRLQLTDALRSVKTRNATEVSRRAEEGTGDTRYVPNRYRYHYKLTSPFTLARRSQRGTRRARLRCRGGWRRVQETHGKFQFVIHSTTTNLLDCAGLFLQGEYRFLLDESLRSLALSWEFIPAWLLVTWEFIPGRLPGQPSAADPAREFISRWCCSAWPWLRRRFWTTASMNVQPRWTTNRTESLCDGGLPDWLGPPSLR